MCGIVGIYNTREACGVEALRTMRDCIVHRGPDDSGEYLDGPLGLGHRRLSIIDLAGGHQPMQTPDGRLTIVFNGEIYNYLELKRELEQDGATFGTDSDTEVILKLHERHGDAAVPRLNGIFAYALWDASERRLLLARDRAGIKPLYVSASARGVAFGSEIKALLESGLVEARLDEARVAEYLIFRQIAGTENLFAGVHALPPGHTLAVRDGKAETPVRYWSPLEPRPRFEGTYEDAVDALDGALNGAVKRQLMSDVPLGTFCSGGIDSSLTTAIAARHTKHPINTFSVGFHEQSYDESAYARLAAETAKSVHHELRIDERDYAELLPKLIWHHDLPLNFANSVHIYAVSRLARESVTVVLTGEGADELFGGYPRYYIPKLLGMTKRLPGVVRSALFGVLARAPDHRLRKLAKVAAETLDDSILYNSTNTDAGLARAALGSGRAAPLEFRRQCLEEARRLGFDTLTTVALIDLQTYLVSILNRQDKMSMATSLEARVPFLDNEIIELAQSLPSEYKQTLRHRKRVLKDVALRYLPSTIVHRRKSGFGVPLAPWFAGNGPMGHLLEEKLRSDAVSSLLDAERLRRLHAEHRDGQADHSELLWSVLNLGIWRETFSV